MASSTRSYRLVGKEMKRVLLTGGGGSIGVHVIAHIMHNTNWEVVGIDSFRHKGEYDRITRVCKNHPNWLDRIKMIQHDLAAPMTERQIKSLGEIDYVLHLASLSDVQGSIDDPVPTIRNNVDITLNTLELARTLWDLPADPVKQPPEGTAFILFSTDEVYGPAEKDQAHKEWSTILPSNPYAASKAAQEAIAISYWRSYNVPLIITNTMNNFGEMQQPNKYPVKIQKAVEGGEEVTVHTSADGQVGTRYYLHSRNAADALLFILNQGVYMHTPGYVDKPDRYNVVGDIQLSNLELAEVIADLMGKDLKYKLDDFHSKQPGHDLHYGLDGEKLEKLGWNPPVNFTESMKNTIEWQQRNKEWIK